MLGVDWAPRPGDTTSPADHYVRVGDLVATYADVPQAAMRTEIYWRGDVQLDAPAGIKPALGAVELMISVQTNMLDSRPHLVARSQLPAVQLLQLVDEEQAEFAPLPAISGDAFQGLPADRPRCVLLRLPTLDVSYAEMVHPADPGRSEIRRVSQPSQTPETFELRHHLFAAELEKGVILRARVLGVLLERAGDEAAAARYYQAFAATAPPLTR